jgi:dTMP kinase
MSSSRKVPFITIEGVDGAGKSSHVATVAALLRSAGLVVVETREPGGKQRGPGAEDLEFCETMRHYLLETPLSLQATVMGAFTNRAEHLDKTIRPALRAGEAVLCDRFTDSTYAYQGAGDGYPIEHIRNLEQMIHGDLQPDLTLLFDLPVEESMRRLSLTSKTPDRFESKPASYFQRVREAYLERAADPRFCIIDSTPSIDRVSAQVVEAVTTFLREWGYEPGSVEPAPPSRGMKI